MIRAGVIWNQRSHRNKAGERAPLPDDVLDIAPEQESESWVRPVFVSTFA